ncbi:eukaryotic translation initiation factor 2 beta subunit [Ophiostoma piceae UAMH 11346]|uniref:Eukaryotic translation initiation factor 2 beta subunit n=1 Tax=Ophiostoma piceae (strain UAMH 11346) TaxID=1262450 RepID=S3C063_OPHP1|nr:eukaryotic translation initiation factor 2 beta subunit [Ophiostoma piceae UAMH 11346]
MPSTEPIDDTKETAVSHSPSTQPLSAALESFTEGAEGADAAGDDGLDLSLLKKKKKKSSKKKEGEDGEEATAAAGEDGGLDPTLKKKKKKKVSKDKAAGDDEFAEKLKELELRDEETAEVDEGDMDKGTGIWAHDCAAAIPYSMMLRRFYHTLEQKNPDHASSGSRSYKIPPPQCMREGNKKTIFANITEVAKRMKRTEDHITLYLLAELGTSGSVDGSRRLVIRGRFQQQHIENVLRKYILEYVVCKTCKSPDTELNKGENRLYFITCNSCGSRRSVTAIKTGFSAQVGKRKKMQG